MKLGRGHSPSLGTLADLQVAYDLGRRLKDAPGSNSAERIYRFVFPHHPLRGYENEEILKTWSICNKLYLENIHRNVADQLFCDDISQRSVLSSHPSDQNIALTMRSFTSMWAQRLYSAAGVGGGYEGARRPQGRYLSVDSAEYKQLMNRENDEIDVFAVEPMLKDPPPMTWATYCDIFVSAIEGNEVFYPNMYRRYKDLTRACEERLITREQYTREPLVYAVECTSKYLARILRHEAVYWLSREEGQGQTWDGFVSIYALMSESRLNSITLSDPRFLACVL